MVGTGAFVALGFGADVAGPWVLFGLCLAALVACGTGVSRVALGSAEPSAVGAYDFGYKYLNAGLGFTAGWAGLVAMATAGAAAALGYSAYVMELLRRGEPGSAMTIAVGAIAGISLLVLSGFRRGNVVNIILTVGALAGLLLFVAMMVSRTAGGAAQNLALVSVGKSSPAEALLTAAALLFPAFMGFSQVSKSEGATSDSRGTRLAATLISVGVALLLYVVVVAVAIAVVGYPTLAEQTEKTLSPLAALSDRYNSRWVGQAVSAGGVLAMLGVLLNLIVGGARLAQAMGAREDLPGVLTKVDSGETPYVATVLLGLAIGGLAVFLDLRTCWNFAAFSTLVYAAFTNLAALKLDEKERLAPKFVPGLALLASVGLIVMLPLDVWATGVVILLGGHVLRLLWVALRPAKQAA